MEVINTDCVDTPGWTDVFNEGCSWYEENDSLGCVWYGEIAGDNGETAKDNCCYCKLEVELI